MRLALAWDAQAADSGGETTPARKAWNWLIKSPSDGGESRNNAKSSLYLGVGDGTRILKDWGRTNHEVLVREDGGSWYGESRSSLPPTMLRNRIMTL